MVMAILAALTLAAPDTGHVPAMEGASAGTPVPATSVAAEPGETAPASYSASPRLASSSAEPRFDLWRPPAMQASPGTAPLPLTLAMPGTMDGQRSSVVGLMAPGDSQQARPVLVDYSDAYYTRLTIHKWASWTMLPLFGLEYYTGTQLYKQGLAAPHWERTIHKPVAVTLAGLFALNTVTGVWNLWDGRKDPDGRAWRTTHGLLMLLADAGFVATGLTAPHFRTESGVYGPGSNLTGGYGHGNERLHKQIAISSMVVATVSWVMMLPPFRRD
ncbi:MAG: hypothetical protein P8Z36_07030 [Gemmatimonadota bacterium]